ncbi:MAG: NgoFVII family restriction endonuclease [Bacteroidia bacterium]|nr:NgoFVII family restriction endonuclease [Bacteroidia bacterium]
MYTNIKKFGGDFRQILTKEFNSSKGVTIASGYASLDIINFYFPLFIRIAKSGGTSRLLLGMAFYEGLSQKKLDAISNLNRSLKQENDRSGVFVTNGRRYHGKVYLFDKNENSTLYVGSSNFSSSGTSGNIECTIPVFDSNQKDTLIEFLEDLYSPTYSITIDKAAVPIHGKKKLIVNKVSRIWKKLKKYNPQAHSIKNLPKIEIPLKRSVVNEKSNLNVYFGKGRLNRKTGIVKPRPWYEIEIIAPKYINSQNEYPKGDFLAYTDDGLIIPMRTQGDYFKNIRSKDSLQIFGIWLKGKLERAGVLQKYQPVTIGLLEEYGRDKLTLYKLEEGKFFMEF